jgi:hypothetical protein
MLLPTVLALLIVPCVAYFEVDTTGTVDDRCPFSWPDYHFEEQDMSTADADLLFSCDAPPSESELKKVDKATANGISLPDATAGLCFNRGCWYAESVVMEATVSIPPGELMHNGFPFSNTFNLTSLPGGNVTGLCFPPKFEKGGGYLCLVDRPPRKAEEFRRQLAPDAGSSTWILAVDYVPVEMNGFARPQVDNRLKMWILIAAAVLITLILIGVLSGGSKAAPPPPQL